MSSVSTADSSADIDAFCDVLASAKCVGILSGAGLSAGSGITTYRGIGGQWNTTDPFSVVSIKAFNEAPGRVWAYFHPRRDECMIATPNAAHVALASLSAPSIRRHLLPSLSDPTKPPLHATQNFDGLCRRALDDVVKEHEIPKLEKDAAYERLVEMHGSAYRIICTQCKAVKWTDETPLAEVFRREQPEGSEIPVEQLPRCGGSTWAGSNRYGQCGGLLRPGVIWFGEVPESQGEIVRVMTKVDVLLVVHPAASYAKTVKSNGGKVAIFNLGPAQGDNEANFVFHGRCEETIPKIFERLGQLNDERRMK